VCSAPSAVKKSPSNQKQAPIDQQKISEISLRALRPLR